MPTKKKPKLGRPNHGLSEKLIAIRMPDALRKAAAKCADRSGMKISEWWRMAAMAQIEADTAKSTKGRG